MKGYLFGLGAMLVGAGLMFVLMHGEVSAEGDKTMYCDSYATYVGGDRVVKLYCKIEDLTCVSDFFGLYKAMSCVKS